MARRGEDWRNFCFVTLQRSALQLTVDRYNENEGNPGVAELGLVGQIVNCYANVETIGIC